MTTLRTQAEAETRAALEGIVVVLDGAPLPAELALVPLRVYGDALRLGLDSPHALRRWADACAPSLLDDVLRATLELVDGRVASTSEAAAADPTVATRLRERDHAESVLHAFRRTWLPRSVTQLAGYGALVARLAEVDQAFATVLSRAQVTRLLGVRAGLGAAWAQGFTDATDGVAAEELPLAILREGLPTPALIASYIESGVQRERVEQAAGDNPEFAEQLADTIVAMCGTANAGFCARRWLDEHAKAQAKRAWTFESPDLARAAASGDDASSTIEHRLGALFPDLDAEATLFVGEREITLDVGFDARSIALIELGTASRTPLATETSCRLTVSRPNGPVLLRVCTQAGREICEELSFDSVES